MSSHVMFLSSKQISYLTYNEMNHELVARYATGECRSFSSISLNTFEQLLHSENRYDDFVRLTQAKLGVPTS
ncbi:hypothetical protein NQ117_09095 [Paenibacillus sp. SC116]|uniref:hypothetical protein n=1 Tax=Paenibacillus sp. SC116 TaxID=2968986 RepID=UPI00215B5EB0|nr:hypothetical protein [Paenibacillus sp. SC116]MCR8843843.1 hypothetical protein [Paenibacillus sp. SC116]